MGADRREAGRQPQPEPIQRGFVPTAPSTTTSRRGRYPTPRSGYQDPGLAPRAGYLEAATKLSTVATSGRSNVALRLESTAGLSAPSKKEAMPKELSTKDRKKLNKNSFALPGKRKYPIPDKAHARNTLARVAQHGTPTEQKKVRAAVRKRFPSIGNRKAKKS